MKLLLIFSIFLIASGECANILAIFSHGAKSHITMFHRIVEGLAVKGHQIDLYSYFVDGINHKNINSVDISKIKPHFTTAQSIADLRNMKHSTCVSLILNVCGSDICSELFNSTTFQLLRDTKKKYDILLVELFGADCIFGFGHHFGIPVVALTSSMDLPWGGYRIGNVHNPSYIRHYFSSVTNLNMGLWDRLSNTLSLIDKNLRQNYYLTEQDLISKNFFGSSLPDLDVLVSNISLLLVNSHFSINQAVSANPNFIEVGGVHIREPKPLSKELLSLINNEKFIYFSLGSIAASETFTPDVIKIIFDVLKELNIKVLWKASQEKFPKDIAKPDNIKFVSWVPQVDLLCSPNILLFITHSGLMSTQEAVYCGVPILSFPLFADQYLNSENVESKGVGKKIAFETVTKEELYSSIIELISSPKYKENVQILSRKFKDRPQKPLDTAVFWIEYVLRYGDTQELKSEARHLAWYQIYLFDILFTVILLCSIFIVSLVYIVKFLINIVFSNDVKLKKI